MGQKDNMKGKKGNGRSKGLGVVTTATAFAVPADPEVEFVRSVEERETWFQRVM